MGQKTAPCLVHQNQKYGVRISSISHVALFFFLFLFAVFYIARTENVNLMTLCARFYNMLAWNCGITCSRDKCIPYIGNPNFRSPPTPLRTMKAERCIIHAMSYPLGAVWLWKALLRLLFMLPFGAAVFNLYMANRRRSQDGETLCCVNAWAQTLWQLLLCHQ